MATLILLTEFHKHMMKIIIDIFLVAPLTLWAIMENFGDVKSAILFVAGLVFLIYRIKDTRESTKLKEAQRKQIEKGTNRKRKKNKQ